jgi:hypothetical protein
MEEVIGFNEGDNVVLINIVDSDGGEYDALGNPLNTVGVICGEDSDYTGRILVNWSNGESNSYIPSNLKCVNVSETQYNEVDSL